MFHTHIEPQAKFKVVNANVKCTIELKTQNKLNFLDIKIPKLIKSIRIKNIPKSDKKRSDHRIIQIIYTNVENLR
jgi:hypothetical protein